MITVAYWIYCVNGTLTSTNFVVIIYRLIF